MKGAASVIVILSSLAAGIGAGRWLRETDTPPPRAPVSAEKPVTGGPPSGADPPAAFPESGPATLPEWDAALSVEENGLALYAALEHVPAARIAEWLRNEYRVSWDFSARRADLVRDTTREALLDRLREKDPAAFADWVSGVPALFVSGKTWAGDAAEALLRSGTPEAAAAAARLKAIHPAQWREAELRVLAESNPEAALAMAGENGALEFPEACADLLAADPARALAYVREHPSSLYTVAAAFQRLGPEALESFAEKCPADSAIAEAVWRPLAAEVARRGDGGAFAAFLLAHPGIQETSAHLLLEADPAAAGEAVRALAGAPALQERVLASLAVADPAQAARLLAESPDAAAMLELTFRDIGQGRPLLTEITRAWTERDPAALRAWARSLPAALQGKVAPRVAAGLTGGEFLDFTRGAPLGDDPAVGELAGRAALIAGDTATLLAWLSGFPEADRERLGAVVCGPLAARDLPAATELAVNLPDLQRREQLIRSAGESAGFTDPRAAAAWGNSLPGDLRVGGLSAAFQAMADRAETWDPALRQAVTEVITAEPEGSVAVWGQLSEAIVRDTGRRSFAEAAAFLAGLPEAVRRGGLGELHYAFTLNVTAAGDPSPALADLERLQDPALRRGLAEALLPFAEHIDNLSAEQTAALRGALETLTR